MTQALAIILIVVSAGAGAALWWMDGKVEAANARATQAVEDRGKEEQSRKGFEAAARKCGESVTALQTASKSLLAAHEKRRKAAEAQTAKAEALVLELLSKERPKGLDECQATVAQLDEEIDRRQKPDEQEPEIDDRHPNP